MSVLYPLVRCHSEGFGGRSGGLRAHGGRASRGRGEGGGRGGSRALVVGHAIATAKLVFAAVPDGVVSAIFGQSTSLDAFAPDERNGERFAVAARIVGSASHAGGSKVGQAALLPGGEFLTTENVASSGALAPAEHEGLLFANTLDNYSEFWASCGAVSRNWACGTVSWPRSCRRVGRFRRGRSHWSCRTVSRKWFCGTVSRPRSCRTIGKARRRVGFDRAEAGPGVARAAAAAALAGFVAALARLALASSALAGLVASALAGLAAGTGALPVGAALAGLVPALAGLALAVPALAGFVPSALAGFVPSALAGFAREARVADVRDPGAARVDETTGVDGLAARLAGLAARLVVRAPVLGGFDHVVSPGSGLPSIVRAGQLPLQIIPELPLLGGAGPRGPVVFGPGHREVAAISASAFARLASLGKAFFLDVGVDVCVGARVRGGHLVVLLALGDADGEADDEGDGGEGGRAQLHVLLINHHSNCVSVSIFLQWKRII